MLKIGIQGKTGRMGVLVEEVIVESGTAMVVPIEEAQVVIDFSVPEGTISAISACVANGIPIVIGTTGLSLEQQQFVERASHDIAIFQAPNMSIGIQVLKRLIQEAKKQLPSSFDVHIIETHHKHKRDCPSGTALALGKALEVVDSKVTPEFTSIRAGTNRCDHEVWFISGSERLKVTHEAFDRRVFAEGAVKAAQWVIDKMPGLYTMEDMSRVSA